MNTNNDFVLAISLTDLTVMRFTDADLAKTYGNTWFVFANQQALFDDKFNVPTASLVALYNAYSAKQVTKFSDRQTAVSRLWDLLTTMVALTTATNERKTKMNEETQTVNTDNIGEDTTQRMSESVAAERSKREAADAARQAKKEEAEKAAAERKQAAADKKAAKDAEKAEKAAAKATAKAERDAAKAAAKAEGGSKTRKSSLAGKLLKHSIGKDADGNVKNPRRPGSYGHTSLQIIIDAGDAGITTEDYVKAGGRMNDLHWDIDHGSAVAEDIAAE